MQCYSPIEIDAHDKQTCFTLVNLKGNLCLGGAPTFWRNRLIPSLRLEVGQEGHYKCGRGEGCAGGNA